MAAAIYRKAKALSVWVLPWIISFFVVFNTRVLSSLQTAVLGATQESAPKSRVGNHVLAQYSNFDQLVNETATAQCFRYNSQQWIEGKYPMYSNVDMEAEDSDETMKAAFDQNLIDGFRSISGETLCHAKGKFRSQQWDDSNEMLIDEWSTKLMYLAIHSYHHAPARGEYNARRGPNDYRVASACKAAEETRNINPFDYECRGAKYLVTYVAGIGMGASFRLGVVTNTLLAIATDRIPLFVSNLKQFDPEGVKDRDPKSDFATKLIGIDDPLALVSCNRGDIQCVLRPPSPCVVSAQDIWNAPAVKDSAYHQLRNYGTLPKELEKERVLLFSSVPTPGKFDERLPAHQRVLDRLSSEALRIVSAWADARREEAGTNEKLLAKYDKQLGVLVEAAKRIAVQDAPDDTNSTYFYNHRHVKVAHVALMYLLRPRPWAKQEIRDQLRNMTALKNDHAPALGMPIRMSDKCNAESTCLPFEKYMALAEETWQDSHRPPDGKLIVTTEDPAVMKKTGVSTPWQVIVNEADAGQGTGQVSKFGSSANDIMISSFVALRMQMHASLKVYGNCCSNFHNVLFDFLRSGCGRLERKEDAVCMQETEKYNMCCLWDKSEECKAMRERKRNEMFHK